MAAAIAARATREPGQAVGVLALQPSPRHAQRHVGRAGGGTERHAVLHVWAQDAPALHRLRTQVVVQLGQ